MNLDYFISTLLGCGNRRLMEGKKLWYKEEQRWCSGESAHQGRIQKIQKEGAECPTIGLPSPPPRMKTSLFRILHTEAYSIVSIFVMQSKVTLTFRKIELKSIL